MAELGFLFQLPTGWGGHLFRRFCHKFSKSSLACLGNMAAEVQPNGLWNSQKTVYKTFRTSGRPTHYTVGRPVIR